MRGAEEVGACMRNSRVSKSSLSASLSAPPTQRKLSNVLPKIWICIVDSVIQ